MISENKIREIAKSLDVDSAAIKAVISVESAGDGMLKDGRPKILFEGHWFSKFTGGAHDETHPEISYSKWDRKKYKGGAKEWDRLEEAKQLNKIAAWKSASWGAFQIMGFNYATTGAKTLDDFIAGMMSGEDYQADAVVNFIKSQTRKIKRDGVEMNMLQALKSKNWKIFAELYNGPGQVEKYAAKLAAACR